MAWLARSCGLREAAKWQVKPIGFTPAVIPGAAPALAKAGVCGYVFICKVRTKYAYLYIAYTNKYAHHEVHIFTSVHTYIENLPQTFRTPRGIHWLDVTALSLLCHCFDWLRIVMSLTRLGHKETVETSAAWFFPQDPKLILQFPDLPAVQCQRQWQCAPKSKHYHPQRVNGCRTWILLVFREFPAFGMHDYILVPDLFFFVI